MPSEISYVEKMLFNGYEIFDYFCRRNNLVSYIENIPIFLVNESSFLETEKGEGEKPSSDWLGCFKKVNIETIEKKCIFICPERIESICSRSEYPIILAKVLIHEIAHAIMSEYSTYHTVDEFYKWIEEPFANLMALEIFKLYSQDEYKVVKKFISKQPSNYKLALDFEKNGFHFWWKWARNKDEIEKKIMEKDAYLNYVKCNTSKTDEGELERLFDDLFK